MIELKPCPFCGGAGGTNSGYTGFFAFCQACECELGRYHHHGDYCGAFDTEEEAAKAWNDRQS